MPTGPHPEEEGGALLRLALPGCSLLLLAAQVCSDWRFVARQPAVWTHLRLQNARVSASGSTVTYICYQRIFWCSSIRSIVMDVAASGYFEEPDSQEAKRLFGEILCTLKVLPTRPGLCDALQVRAEGF